MVEKAGFGATDRTGIALKRAHFTLYSTEIAIDSGTFVEESALRSCNWNQKIRG